MILAVQINPIFIKSERPRLNMIISTTIDFIYPHLLQWDFLKSGDSIQTPFHLEGISPIPWSLKLGDSGHIPKRKTIMLNNLMSSFELYYGALLYKRRNFCIAF